jgi:hypothetical protein
MYHDSPYGRPKPPADCGAPTPRPLCDCDRCYRAAVKTRRRKAVTA